VPEAHEFRWVGELARRAGIVVHAFLQRIATEGVERWNEARLRETQPAILAALKLEGVGEGELRRGEELVSEALRRTLRNERGRWLLAPHPEARCEWALTALLDGELERVRVDRTFLAEGVRWLIDYKLSPRLGGGREAFLAGQLEKYRPDLERYARVLRLLESGAGAAHPLRCALYFPLMGEFCEVKVG
jgi:ATP-dependent helicase/nuclease subunit A